MCLKRVFLVKARSTSEGVIINYRQSRQWTKWSAIAPLGLCVTEEFSIQKALGASALQKYELIR